MTMFFEGDLQSGIALALTESKSVACFVKSDNGQSFLWEEDFLKDEQIVTALTAKAITIRINSGSQEAQHLAAYHPVPVLPAFIIINNGQLVVDIRAGESKDRFINAVLRALSSSLPQPSRTTLSQTPGLDTSMTQRPSYHLVQPETSNSGPHLSSASSPSALTQSTPFNPDPNASSPTAHNIAAHANIPPPSSPYVDPTTDVPSDAFQSMADSSTSNERHSQTVQGLLADRRRRLERDKKEKDAAEKAERKAKAEARREAVAASPNSAKAKQAMYAAQQRKRQQEAKLERERILRQIEQDKSERKEKEERRKALAEAEAKGDDGANGLVDRQLASEVNLLRSAKSGECAVQVRLFDGSTIRSKFPSDQTLRANVRPWIDRIKPEDIPYTFKQVLTPMPNRTLSISEEEEDLQALGLSPSATLVIVPIEGYAAAYTGEQGLVSKGASAGYSVIAAGAGIITEALGTLFGLGRASAAGDLPNAQNTTTQGDAGAGQTVTGPGINIRALRDQREDQDHYQLYNGNQLNFEPQRDKHNKDE